MKPVPHRLIVTLVALMMVLGSAGQAAIGHAQDNAGDIPKPEGAHGIQAADIDLTIDPGDDFYGFANGGWAARNELPDDVPVYGALNEASIRVDEYLFESIQDFEPDPDTPQGKARLYYDQALDTETRNDQGIEPIQPLLDEIQAISSIEDGLAFQEDSDSDSLVGLFAPFASASPTDATTTVAWLFGPNLSLPGENYYLDDSDDAEDVREAWIATTTELLIELGYTEDDAASAAEGVMAFETELATAKTPEEILSIDPNARNNPRTLDELQAILPSFDWDAFVEKTEIPDGVDTIHVSDIAYLEALDGLLTGADPLTLRHLFATQVAWEFSPYLTTEIEEIAFSFTGPVLLGVSEQPHPIEVALELVESTFPDTFGQVWVDEFFPPEAKAEVEDLVDNLIAAFRIRIEEAAWMSEETRARALEKLDLMSVEVGYPAQWDTYDDVEIGDSLFETFANHYDATNEESLGKVGEPVDRSDWPMAAFEVNAGYIPSRNMIVFPAGILQAPFFDPQADLAANYGSIGAVIGHEITHGFDLSGSQFDGFGNLVEWWTEDDIIAFSELNERVVAHYSAIEALPGLAVDGGLTVTENVADMGGVQVAFDAMLIVLDGEAETDQPWLFTQEQRFFVAFAGTWRQRATPEFLEYLVSVDVHAPSQVRAVEPIRHMDAFYDAFDIGPGDAEYLAPDDRIVIW